MCKHDNKNIIIKSELKNLRSKFKTTNVFIKVKGKYIYLYYKKNNNKVRRCIKFN